MSHLYHLNFGGDALGFSGTKIWKMSDTGRPKTITTKATTCIQSGKKSLKRVVRPQDERSMVFLLLYSRDPLTAILIACTS